MMSARHRRYQFRRLPPCQLLGGVQDRLLAPGVYVGSSRLTFSGVRFGVPHCITIEPGTFRSPVYWRSPISCDQPKAVVGMVAAGGSRDSQPAVTLPSLPRVIITAMFGVMHDPR